MRSSQRRASNHGDAEAPRRLIDAAQRLLANAGAESLTSRSITDAAGVNLAAITYYFGSKQELVDQAMLALAGTLLEPVLEELDSDSKPIPKMLNAIDTLNRVLSDNRSVVGAYLQTVSSAATGSEVHEPLTRLIRSVEEVLEREITRQRDAGGLPTWVDPRAMAQLIMATVHGTLVVSSLEPDRVDHTRIAAQFAQLLLAARTDPPENRL